MKRRLFVINNGKLILGYAKFHDEILNDNSKTKCGGLWYDDEEDKILYLYDQSIKFGMPDDEDIQTMIIPDWVGNKGYTISFQPGAEFLYQLTTKNGKIVKQKTFEQLPELVRQGG